MSHMREDGSASQQSVVRTYDFRRSRRLSADHVRSLQRVHEQFASLLSTYLTAYLRTRVICDVREISQTMFDDFVRGLPQRNVVATMDVAPFTGSALLRFGSSLAHGLIDRLLGGSGDLTPVERPFTEIDVRVLERGLPVALEALSEAWSGVERLHFQSRLVEASPQFLRLVSPQDIVVEVDVEVSFASMTGELSIILPYDVLKPLLPKLSTVAYMEGTDDGQPTDIESGRQVRSQAMGIDLEVTAVLGEAHVTMQEFMQLEEGDVIMLGTKAGAPVPLYVGDRLKFLAEPYVQGRHLVVRIKELVQARERGELPAD